MGWIEETVSNYRDQISTENTRADKETRYFFYERNKANRIPLEDKERWSIELLKMALQKHKNPVVSCSFGIDSVVSLYLTRKALMELGRDPSDIVVFWGDTLNEFQEVRQYAKMLTKEWDLNLLVGRPKKPLKKIIDENGGITSDYFTARKGKRTNGVPLSEKCCRILKHEPYKRARKENKHWDLQINGIRADESMQRFLSSLRDGDYYYAKSEWKLFSVRPILWWDDFDVWEYVERESIPYNDLYNKNMIKKYPENIKEIVSEHREEIEALGINADDLAEQRVLTLTRWQAIHLQKLGVKHIFKPRTGCAMCPIPVKYGYMKWLRTYYPKVYNAMLHNLGYAKGLMELLPKEAKEELEFLLGYEITVDNIDEVLGDVLQAKPCVFDFDEQGR